MPKFTSIKQDDKQIYLLCKQKHLSSYDLLEMVMLISDALEEQRGSSLHVPRFYWFASKNPKDFFQAVLHFGPILFLTAL